ncbi:MAG: aminopeptidase N [Gammaproteobacteria bacterium]|nr:aminopeptidase N [Gammaproteobacteria bacterium]
MKTTDSPRITYLKDYQPSNFLIDHVQLTFELGEEQTRVTALSHVKRNPLYQGTDTSLFLYGTELQLAQISINGDELAESGYSQNAEGITLNSVPEEFHLQIATLIEPQNNTTLEGLYKSSGMFCTQCEAEGFRRITYFLDRPDVMAFYTTTVIADREKYPVLLSNGNRVDEGVFDDGRHWVKWHDPYRKPSYLFALVAGDLLHQEDTFVTRSGREVVLQIFVEKANIDKTAHAMLALKKAMKWDEEVFGLQYDLDIYMIVAVNDFNMGAMENKGLNIFNSSCVLARSDTATDADFENIEAIIAHEYFHNWTGNRVTCRDWFQLSLKEGLTVFRDEEFTSDVMSRPVKRIADVNVLRTAQFPQDAGPMAHPVRPDSFIDISNFYTVTVYNKGAEVVRMMHTLIGKENFRKGMDLYFQRHDGQAVTCDDFAQAMQDASGVDLSQFKHWYSQAGTPVVNVEREYDAVKQEYVLRFTQACPATPGQSKKEPFHIPVAVGLLDHEGNDLALHASSGATVIEGKQILELKNSSEEFRFTQIKREPVPSLLRGFSAPVKLEFDYSDDELMFLMANDNDEFNRWEAGQRLAVRIINGLIGDLSVGKTLSLRDDLVQAFRKVLLNEQLDKSLVSQALMLPNEIYLAEMQSVVDPAAIHRAREFVANRLASALREDWQKTYQSNRLEGDYVFNAENVAARQLKNTALAYLVRLNDADTRALAVHQFDNANNMTDELAAMGALANIACGERLEVLQRFYDKWQYDPLVVDKWFAVQSRADQPDAIAQIKSLVQHPAFEIRNPNKVRSVIGGFAFGNPVHFHDVSGEGYHFVADAVLELAKLNPQMSARIATAFSQWRRFDTQRADMMRAQLTRIEQAAGLPKDVYEIVAKTLGDV